MTTKTEMVTFDQVIKFKGSKAIKFFSDKDNLIPLIDFVKSEVSATVRDVKTKKGRDAIGSTALKISKSRKALTDAIDASIADLKSKVKKAKDVSDYIVEELNQVRSEVLAPRDTWQTEQDLIEEKRIKDIKAEVDNILAIGTLQGSESKEEIASLVEAVESIDVSEGFEEFTADAAQAVKDVLKTLNDKVLSIIEADRQEEQATQLAAEQKRNQITERLNKLAMIPMSLISKPSSEIKAKIDSLNNYVVPESDFGESYQQAVDSVQTVISQLTSMHDQQIIVEEQSRLMNIQNEDLPIDEVINNAATHGVGIMDGEGQSISPEDFYQQPESSMAESIAKAVPEQVKIDAWKAEYALLLIKQCYSPLYEAQRSAEAQYENIDGDIDGYSPQDGVDDEIDAMRANC